MTEKPLTDRERILTHIIVGLERAAILRRHGDPFVAASWADSWGGTHVHFARYRKPVKGDLVMAVTGPTDRFKIAFYESDVGDGNHVVREIGTSLLCNYGNEEFIPIVGLDYHDLLVGDEYALLRKVRQAFALGDEYLYRFGGLRIQGGKATVHIREAHALSKGSTPFPVELDWTPQTTVAAILEHLRAGGYGTRSFAPPAGDAT